MKVVGTLAAVIGVILPASVYAVGGEDAAAGSGLEIGYTLYAGGITLGRVDLSARLEENRYVAHSTLTTAGVVNSFWRAKLEGASEGKVDAGHVLPERYDASHVYDGPRSDFAMRYTSGLPAITTPDPPDPLPEDKIRSTLDPVSALVSFVASANTQKAKPCSQAAPVFDGRRRYDMTLSFERKTDVKMDSGLYAGPVEVCQLHFKPVAGPEQEVLPASKIPPVRGWIASVRATNGQTYLVPLRIWAETPYGLVVVLLSKISVDGAALAKLEPAR